MKASISDPPISSGCVQLILIPPLTLSAHTSAGVPGISGTGVGVAVGLGVAVGKLDMTIGVGSGTGTGVGTAILGA